MSVACSSVISRGTNLLRAGRGNYFLPSKLSEINYTVELKKTFSMYNHLRGKRRDYFEEKSSSEFPVIVRWINRSLGRR